MTSRERNSPVPRTRNRQMAALIDRGGTFTDIVARKPDGTLVTHKLRWKIRSVTATRPFGAFANCSAFRPAKRFRPAPKS